MPAQLSLADLQEILARELTENRRLRYEREISDKEADIRREIEWLQWENEKLRKGERVSPKGH